MKTLELHEDFLFFAFRYALGRRTYVVSMMVSELKKQWDNLDPHTKSKIQKEITEAIQYGDAGMDIDVHEWKTILDLDI